MGVAHIPPNRVLSPKRNWVLVTVLVDEGEGGVALALGRWDGDPVLAIRWNGTPDRPIGNPQSRGLPTWFVISVQFRQAILDSLDLSRDKKVLVKSFFNEEKP